MDKYEYKIRTEEIKELIARKEYVQAAEIADTIDWRRVKSVMMLCTISDLYKINRRYEDSMDLLLLAYERHPGGRTIVYSLCELAIKMGDYTQALEYCKEFIQIAPRDSGRYVLQYKLYEAQDVSLEERIAVLEELKKRDYREKWAYELAYLYHRVGLATKCVEECDELIVWFGDGKYVIKAMELKMLHQPLTPEQQRKYDMRFGEEEEAVEEPIPEEEPAPEEESVPQTVDEAVLTAATTRIPAEELDIQIKTMGLEQYDTINLQAEVAAGVKEFLESQTKQEETEVFFGATAEIESTKPESLEWYAKENATVSQEPEAEEEIQPEPAETNVAETVLEQMREEKQAEPPKEMAKVLSMEGDGQISFLVPEKEAIEKQITGQLSIADIMAEWERMKKELEEKRQEEVRKIVQQNTDAMFTEFEESIRDGLLEQLESGRDIEEVLAEAEGRSIELDDAEELVDEVEELAEIEEVVTVEEEPGDISMEEDEPVIEPVIAAEEPDSEEDTAEDILELVDEVEELPEIEEIVDIVEELEETEEEADVDEAELTDAEEIMEEQESWEHFMAEEEDDSLNEEDFELGDFSVQDEVQVEEAEVVETAQDEEEPKPQVRSLTKEEKELFGPYIQGRSSKEQIINTIDNISLAAYTGNVIITGAEGLDTLGLAKNIIREVQLTDNNFSGKIAKISGETLNQRDIAEVLKGLTNGALIIQKAGGLNKASAQKLYRALQQEDRGIIVILEGTKKAINTLLEETEALQSCFTARVDMEALSDAALVAFGKKYAKENEHSIDELGILALHRTITERQTSDHVVTISEVKEIVDDAIDSADRKTIGHFFAIITAKRYDDEDMIIIRENDFV